MNQKLTKHDLWHLISKKIDHSIHRLHVLSVINILIDELIKELKIGNNIKITGLGTFKLSNLKPKKIRSVRTNKIKFAKRTKSLRLKLTKKILKFLSKKSLDKMKNSVEICEEKQDL